MNVGYLHLGPEDHGIRRYSTRLAEAVRTLPRVSVREAYVSFSPANDPLQELRARLLELEGCAVIHAQYSGALWGSGFTQLRRIRALLHSQRAATLLTLHDVYPPRPPFERPQPLWRDLEEEQRGPDATTHVRNRRSTRPNVAELLGRKLPHYLTWKALAHDARLLIVHGHEETRRLAGHVSPGRVAVIPHFVEERPTLPTRSEAKRALGLEGRTVLTVLGFIHPRKGHALAVDALEHLEPNVTLLLAGAATAEHVPFLQGLVERAQSLGRANSLKVTGYLDEERLNLALAATDLAVCPFRFASASGSLSTWLSARKAVLASRIPQADEYSHIEPGAVTTFSPYTAKALAQAITEILRERASAERAHLPFGPDLAAQRLGAALSLASVAELHLRHYRSLLPKGHPADHICL